MTNIPPTFKFKGDREKSISLKAQARQFYNFVINQAEVGGLRFISRALRLSDGSLITVFSKKEDTYHHRTGFILIDTSSNPKVRVEEEYIYMESGFIDFISTGKCTEAAYRPGTLNYNAKVTALLGSSDTPVQGKVKLEDNDTVESPFSGEVIADGAQSLSTGCSEDEMQDSVTTPPPCTEVFYNGGYCGLSLQQRKDCMLKVPASMYTGKLRLFVQAMYGSTREDFSYSGARSITLTDQSGQIYQNAKDGVITLGNQGINQSYWLYTIGNGGYALCYMQYPNIVMIPLILPDIALKFAEAFATHPNNTDFSFKTKIEAYLLAYAVPVYDSSLWLKIPISGPMPAGDPLSYGWHSNWSGTEAHIVTFKAAATTDRFTSNQYKLTITQAESGGVITFAAAITVTEADKDWSNWSTSIHLFYYDEPTLQMMALAKPGSFPPADFNFDSPIYCFTALNISTGDCELNTVRVFNDKQPVSSYNNSPNQYWWPANHGNFTIIDTKTYDAGAKKGALGVKIVSNSSTTVLSGSMEGRHSYNFVEWVLQTTYWDSFAAGSDIYNGAKVDDGWSSTGTPYLAIKDGVTAYVEFELGNYRMHGISGSGITVASAAFVEVPLYCSDAVICGCQTQTQYAGGYNDGLSNGVCKVHRDVRLQEAPYDVSYGWYKRNGNILNQLSVGKLNTTNPNYQMPVGVPGSYTYSVTKNSGDITYDVKIKEKIGAEIVTQVYTSSNYGDARYFAPTLSSPGTGTIDTARASIQSGAISTHTLYTSDYGFIKNASVGWA